MRWWAPDAALVACAAAPTPEAMAYATPRLGIILDADTVYLDLWLCDLPGNVLAHGRPDRYPGLVGRNVAGEDWFRRAAALPDGDAYVAADVTGPSGFGWAQVATYCASVRADGNSRARPIGLLAIHFDWQTQARAIVDGVRMAGEDRARTRVLLVPPHARQRDLCGARLVRGHRPVPGLIVRQTRTGIAGWSAMPKTRV